MILASALAVGVILGKAIEPEHAELVVVMDTSGSTDISQKALRGYAIQRAQDLYDYYGPGKFRLAFITYSNGVLSANVHDFTTDPDRMLNLLAGPLVLHGGKEEATDVVLSALTALKWSRNKQVNRMLLVMGNEPPKQGVTTIDKTAEAAAKDKISISTYFSPWHALAGDPKPWEEWAAKGGGDYRFMSESDLVSYTELYDSFHRRIVEQEWLRRDRESKAAYLDNLMRKRTGSRSGGN